MDLNRDQLLIPPITMLPYAPARRDTSDLILAAIREGMSNASNYNATGCHIRVVEMPDPDGRDERWLLFAHNGRPFKDIFEIAGRGCTPCATERKGDSLNGCGLHHSAIMFRQSDKSSLIIASACEDGLFAAVRASENYPSDGGTEWGLENVSEWTFKSLEFKLGEPEWLRKWKVFYMFRLPDNYPVDGKSALPPPLMACLAFLCSEYMHSGHGEPQEGRMRTDLGETFVPSGKKCIWNSGADGGRKLCPKEEYLTRYQGDGAEFVLPAEGDGFLPPLSGGAEDNVRLKGRIVLRHLPVVKDREKAAG